MSSGFDLSVLGEHMPGDPRGPITFRHLGHGQLQALWDSRLVCDRDNHVVQRDATPLEVALLRLLGLIPPYNDGAPDLVRAVIRWHASIRELQFTINHKPVTAEGQEN